MTEVDPSDVVEILRKVTSSLASGGEDRFGQAQMAEAVTRAMKDRRHRVVQAGTGTGTGTARSLAYLVPLPQSGARAVVATATTSR